MPRFAESPLSSPVPIRRRRPTLAGALAGGLVLIAAEMVQLVAFLALAIGGAALAGALAVKANDHWNLVGTERLLPALAKAVLGPVAALPASTLAMGLLLAVFGIKFVDLIVRMLRRSLRAAGC